MFFVVVLLDFNKVLVEHYYQICAVATVTVILFLTVRWHGPKLIPYLSLFASLVTITIKVTIAITFDPDLDCNPNPDHRPDSDRGWGHI